MDGGGTIRLSEKDPEMRVLDLGCGVGLTPQKLSFPVGWQIIGLDVNYAAVDRVIANVALPYMDIAKALAETHRVLTSGGTLLASLHPFTFTLAELRKALPTPNIVMDFFAWLSLSRHGVFKS